MPARKPRDIEADIDASLRRCNLRCSGLWCKMRYQIEHICDGRPGELWLNGAALDAEQIAIIAGCSAAMAATQLDKLLKVGLITSAGGIIASPLLARIREIRAQQRARVQAHRGRKVKRALRNAPKGVTLDRCNTFVTKDDPLSSFPPTTPLSYSPLSQIPFPSETGGAAAPTATDRNISIQNRVMEEVWKPKWAAAHHGETYCPGKADFAKLAEILAQLGSKRDEAHAVERFGKIADTALAVPQEFGWQGHKLRILQDNLNWLISETAAREKGIKKTNGNNNHGKPSGSAARTIPEGLTL